MIHRNELRKGGEPRLIILLQGRALRRLQVAMGQLEISRAWLEYTYGKIDRDATLAAFNSDDFYWGTGYEGHRFDIGAAAGRGSSVHAIASHGSPGHAFDHQAEHIGAGVGMEERLPRFEQEVGLHEIGEDREAGRDEIRAL